MALSLPKVARGTVTIPVVKKKLPKVVIAIGIVAIIGIIYYTQVYKKKAPAGGLKAPLQPDPMQTMVDYEIIPNEVRPNSYVTLIGQFTDLQGKPVSVPTATYYVWETDINTNGKELRSQGSMGFNVSRFSQNVPTTSFRQGQFSITVTDAPLPPNEAVLLSKGPIVTGGSGAVARPPEGSTSPESVTFAIS